MKKFVFVLCAFLFLFAACDDKKEDDKCETSDATVQSVDAVDGTGSDVVDAGTDAETDDADDASSEDVGPVPDVAVTEDVAVEADVTPGDDVVPADDVVDLPEDVTSGE